MLNCDNLMVSPFDIEALKKHIAVFVPLKENQEYYLGKDALFSDNVVLDSECCYGILEKKFDNGLIDYVYDISVRIKKHSANGASMSMFPEFYFPINVDYLKSHFVLKECSLKEFMGSRFDYNPRITKNTKEFIRDMNRYYQESPVV